MNTSQDFSNWFDHVDAIVASIEHNVAVRERYARMSDADLRAAHPRLVARCADACRDAIGRPERVRVDKKTVQGGVIVEASLARLRVAGNSVLAVFRIVMECGAKKTRREFDVTSLPCSRRVRR